MSEPVMPQFVMRADNLGKKYTAGGALFGTSFWAVRDASLTVARGETVSIVGESGSGKTTLARMLVGLEKPDAGTIDMPGTEGLGTRARRRTAQMVFQDPTASLNPRRLILDIVAEPLDIHRLAKGAARLARVEELLALVGLDPAMAQRFPHEFSGGQRQRIGIARALAAEPVVLICDEAVSALDVSVQAQVVNLLMDLQARLGLAIVFIAHDLAVVRSISTSVMVMYMGRVVEMGPVAQVMDAPSHPYTQALRASVLDLDPARARAQRGGVAMGEPSNPVNPPKGCSFHPRCPLAVDACRMQTPPLQTLSGGVASACLRAEDARRLAKSPAEAQ